VTSAERRQRSHREWPRRYLEGAGVWSRSAHRSWTAGPAWLGREGADHSTADVDGLTVFGGDASLDCNAIEEQMLRELSVPARSRLASTSSGQSGPEASEADPYVGSYPILGRTTGIEASPWVGKGSSRNCHSARRRLAGRIRAATMAGPAANRLATTRVPRAIVPISWSVTTGTGTTPR
jgi:hypothetical protein